MSLSKIPKDVWAVVHHIHVRTPQRHIAKLFVTDVPKGVRAQDVERALTRAGHVFSEFNIPFANHDVERLTDAADEVIGAWRNGAARAVSWEHIRETDEK